MRRCIPSIQGRFSALGSHFAPLTRWEDRLVKQPLDARMQALLPIVQGLAEMFGADCEVVLHDVGRLPHSIVAIENGSLTGRTVGDGPTDRMLRNLRNSDEAQDVRLYISSHAGDIRDVVSGMVTKILGEMGRTPGAMTREEKMEVVKRLEERGAFLVKRS